MPHEFADQSDHNSTVVNPLDGSRREFVRRIWIVAGIISFTVAAISLIWVGREIFLLTFAGILLGVFFRGAADAIASYTPLSKGWALVTFLTLMVLIIGAGCFLLAPSVIEQTEQLISQLPESQERIKSQLSQYKLGKELLANWPSDGGLSKIESYMGRILGIFSTSVGAFSGILVVFFVGLFLAATPNEYIDGVVRLVPPSGRSRCRKVLKDSGHTLRWWLLGRSVAMLFVGTFTAVGLWLLGIPVALPIALMTTILGFVPFFGPIVAAIPAVALGLLQGPGTAASVAGLYLVVQVLEGNVLTPLVQRQVVSIPPALTILAIVLMGILLGSLGMVLAMPLTAVLFVLVKELYVKEIESGGAIT